MPIGVDVVKLALNSAPNLPGVYKMYDILNILIYVGKAKDIHKRLQSYTRPDISSKTKVLVSLIARVDCEITKTEEQALVLEASLVKTHQPKYNILLKDDKSRTYIKISKHELPAIQKYRGKFDKKSHLFGPFGYIQGSDLTTGQVIKNIMDFTSKVFKIRSCKDTKLKIHQSMQKPCMEYQIGTCSAPCAKKISKEDYQSSVRNAISFLNGNYQEIHSKMKERINKHAQKFEFPEAQNLKNQITAIEKLRSNSLINFSKYNNLDIVTINSNLDMVEVFSIRNGYALGGNIFDINKQENEEEALEKFLYQYYNSDNLPPKDIFTSCNVNAKNIKLVFQELFGTVSKVIYPQRGENKDMLDFVLQNLEHQTKNVKNLHNQFAKGMEYLQKIFNLSYMPQRVEIYDNSHISGAFFLGAFVVATQDGFDTSSYRKFNAKFSKGGDDYAMMREVMIRRFGKNIPPNEMPDLLIIDGGLGQFTAVTETLDEMGINIFVVSIAKGRYRNAGNETFFTKENPKGFKISQKEILYFVQTLRDEAHRFAITSHRKRREKIF